MYPSANSDNPFEFLLKRSLFHCDHQSPSSNQNYNDPHFLPNFPSPFFDEHELPLNQILSQTQPMSGIGNHNTNILRTDSTKDKTPEKSSTMSPNLIEKSAADHHQKPLIKRRNLGAIPRKRTGKKDRHSKICTAQGIRDRRMRLSLQVARKFFDLQDMLGYDKASKTIEWLFTNSKHAIKELIDNEGKSTESIISEYEGVSGIEETSNINVQKTPNRIEMRDKARARARSRTKEKMMTVMMMNTKHDGDVKKIGSSSNNPFESTIVDQESSSINNQEKVDIYPSFDQSSQFDDVGTIEKLLQGSLSSSASCSILGNWDLSDIDQVSLGGNPSSNLSVTADFPLFHQ